MPRNEPDRAGAPSGVRWPSTYPELAWEWELFPELAPILRELEKVS